MRKTLIYIFLIWWSISIAWGQGTDQGNDWLTVYQQGMKYKDASNNKKALQLLKQAHKEKPLSLLPQIWTDYKRDELANIYKGKGTQKEKETVYDILFGINASQSDAWNKLKE